MNPCRSLNVTDVITAGSQVLFDYDAGDTAMRNIALAVLRQLGFPGRRVAAVLGLTENYVATLHNAALRGGSAALIGQPRPGRPGKLTEADWAAAAAWRDQGASDAQIGRRLGIAHTTVARRLGPRQASPDAQSAAGTGGRRPQPEPLFPGSGPTQPGSAQEAGPGPAGSEPGPAVAAGVSAPGSELVPVTGAGLVPVPPLPPAPGAELAPVPGGAVAVPGCSGRHEGVLMTAGARII